jgi:serine/threonine-protein kinase
VAPPPLNIRHYRIDGVIGRGGMGVVYLAYDTKLGRKVALKAISPEFVHDPSRRERLRREGRALAALSHPGIATLYALEDLAMRC